MGEAPAYGLSEQLEVHGFEVGRMKTGTPARIDGRSIDFSKLKEQAGDKEEDSAAIAGSSRMDLAPHAAPEDAILGRHRSLPPGRAGTRNATSR